MDILALHLSFYLVVCMLEMLYGIDIDGKGGCAILPMITPSRIVQQYGTSFEANCSLCGNGTCYKDIKWETPLGNVETLIHTDNGINNTIVRLKVDNATEWGMQLLCYSLVEDLDCYIRLPVTLYKPPDNVSISFVNHTGPLLEGHQYTLQCRVQNVAPVQNLTVTFYRGNAMLDLLLHSSNSAETLVTETFTVSINSSREDDGVQYSCEAVLNLGPQGPKPPPVSHLLTTTVYFKPQMEPGMEPDLISITEGETLQLNCTVHSNPSPAYSWIGPDNTTISNSDSVLTVQWAGFEHEGQYVCAASNSQGSTTMKFNVDIKVDSLPIIAGVAVLCLVILGFITGLMYNYHYRQTRTGHYKLKDVFRMNRANAGLLGGSNN